MTWSPFSDFPIEKEFRSSSNLVHYMNELSGVGGGGVTIHVFSVWRQDRRRCSIVPKVDEEEEKAAAHDWTVLPFFCVGRKRGIFWLPYGKAKRKPVKVNPGYLITKSTLKLGRKLSKGLFRLKTPSFKANNACCWSTHTYEWEKILRNGVTFSGNTETEGECFNMLCTSTILWETGNFF